LNEGPSYEDPFNRDSSELDELDKNLLMDVKKYGFHIVLVGGEDPSHDHPSFEGPWPYNWAYSIGLYYSYTHPEVVTVGLSDDTLGWMISAIGNRVGSGERFQPGEDYGEIIQGYACTFVPVVKLAYPEFLSYATWFYRGEGFPALQCVWPDHDGLYPWQRGSRASVQQANLQDENADFSAWGGA
jgi:hypothetical protein